jgi:hypothetical protein
VYILSRDWYNKWKVHVNYKRVKQGYKDEQADDETETTYPGMINNEDLLKSFSKYIRDNEPDDPTNFILKRKALRDSKYKIIPRECWNLFCNKYGGVAIVRYKDNSAW